MKYYFDGISLKNGRQENMDSLLLKVRQIGKKNALLAVVCDGVGSLADGAFASKTAVQMLSEWFNKTETIDHIGIAMRDIITEINLNIIEKAKKKNLNTASTLSALLLAESDYYTAHVGDSRIYSCENGTLSILTCDDVTSTGKLTAYIGQAEKISLQYSAGNAAGKIFLICSDGLYKQMDTDFMLANMKTWSKYLSKEPIETLVQYVVERGEQDNISIALTKINK